MKGDNKLGAALRKTRLSLGQSVQEIADMLSVSRNSVYNWENHRATVRESSVEYRIKCYVCKDNANTYAEPELAKRLLKINDILKKSCGNDARLRLLQEELDAIYRQALAMLAKDLQPP